MSEPSYHITKQLFRQLSNRDKKISPKSFNFLKAFNSYIKEWFPDQNSILLEIEDKTNITVVVS